MSSHAIPWFLQLLKFAWLVSLCEGTSWCQAKPGSCLGSRQSYKEPIEIQLAHDVSQIDRMVKFRNFIIASCIWMFFWVARQLRALTGAKMMSTFANCRCLWWMTLLICISPCEAKVVCTDPLLSLWALIPKVISEDDPICNLLWLVLLATFACVWDWLSSSTREINSPSQAGKSKRNETKNGISQKDIKVRIGKKLAANLQCMWLLPREGSEEPE